MAKQKNNTTNTRGMSKPGYEIHVELLLGRRVFASNSQPVGRIEEIYAEPRNGECYIQEYLIGSYALFERLAAWGIFRHLVSFVGGKWWGKKYRVNWDKLDLTDAEKPRLMCSISELEEFVDERG